MSNFRETHTKAEAVAECSAIFGAVCSLTDAERYFSQEELKQEQENFIDDLMNNYKSHYVNFLREEIAQIMPSTVYGCYDLELIKEYKEIINRIESF